LDVTTAKKESWWSWFLIFLFIFVKMVPWEDLQTRGLQFADDRYLYFWLKCTGSEMARSGPILIKLWQNFLLCVNINEYHSLTSPCGCCLGRILHWKKTIAAVNIEYVLK